VVEGVAFYVKYLGSCLVDSATGEEATGGAIKTITMMARKQDRKLERVALTISLRGIHMEPQGSDLEASTNFSIYRVSYCSTDTLAHTSSFAFIATNKNDTLECHAFLCPHRKMAQAATLTIAQAFNLAFKQWKEEQEKTAARAEGGEMVELVTQKPLAARPEEGGVQSEAPKQHETKRNETPASEGPSVAYHRKTEQISLGPAGRGGPGEGQLIVERRGRGEHHGPLLIDLSSLSPALAGVGERGPAEEEDMMMSFTQ
jgi:low density lipoprotein receptor adapter protein 1